MKVGGAPARPEARRPWEAGLAPVGVVMISLNEAHNMRAMLEHLKGWAHQVFLVDSYSRDSTVDAALEYGVHVVQRPFRGFGEQWNFALRSLPITAPWTMKLDPDERLTNGLKQEIVEKLRYAEVDAFEVPLRLFFMRRRLSVKGNVLRLWRTGSARMTDVAVNEHPVVDGRIGFLSQELEHHDSPDLEHWIEKQNRYTTAEAIVAYRGLPLADIPRLLGTPLQRRMWFKKHFYDMPFHYWAIFLYHYLVQSAWRAGWPGYAWARLRADVMRLIEYKRREMEITGRIPDKRLYGSGTPDSRVLQGE